MRFRLYVMNYSNTRYYSQHNSLSYQRDGQWCKSQNIAPNSVQQISPKTAAYDGEVLLGAHVPIMAHHFVALALFHFCRSAPAKKKKKKFWVLSFHIWHATAHLQDKIKILLTPSSLLLFSKSLLASCFSFNVCHDVKQGLGKKNRRPDS